MKKAMRYGVAVVLLTWGSLATGATLYVGGGSPGAYASIQAAIDPANPGDDIEVAPGTYVETINFWGKAVHLYSSGGAAVTTIDGGGTGPVVTCTTGEGPGTILEGFTITGGSSPNNGGGMFNYNSSPTLTNCTFGGNTASYGGGIYSRNSDPTITGCTFSDNSAVNHGGGMYNISDGDNTKGSTTVTNCTFIGNSASHGGGMYNHGNSPAATNCTFNDNSAEVDGGGMYNYYGSTTVTDCEFSSNRSTAGDGGGIFNSDSSPTVTDCEFSNNRSIAGSGGGICNYRSNLKAISSMFSSNVAETGGGGGIFNNSSNAEVINCTFSNNSGPYNGGGILNMWYSGSTIVSCAFICNASSREGGGMYDYLSKSVVTNCTFTGNSASWGGGSISGWAYPPTVTNCILWGNSDCITATGATITYSDVEGGGLENGNINADPLFVGGGDYHLQPKSPCINAGTNDAVTATTDLDGNPRIAYGRADMGAYEYGNTAPQITTVIAPLEPVQVNTMVTVSGSFSDPDIGDTHTGLWSWGDGASTDGVVDEETKTVGGSHTYAAAGTYTLTLTITDADGESDQETFQYVVVYDPAGGFVTGGGWIDSPAGAYLADPTLAGKANFGFVSKYQKGANVPTGNTEFQFKAGDLNFHSNSYDWLVVNQSGTNAQYKGSGTINGEGLYRFMLWAGDGVPDTFRIKIWSEDESGAEQVVYDNGVSQPIGGGSIVVHKE